MNNTVPMSRIWLRHMLNVFVTIRQDVEPALIAALAATLKADTAARRRSSSTSVKSVKSVLRSTLSAAAKTQPSGKARRSRSLTGEAAPVLTSGEGLVLGPPPPLVRVQRMSWPGDEAAAGATAAADEDDQPRRAFDAAEVRLPETGSTEDQPPDAGLQVSHDPTQLGTAADEPWPDLSRCAVSVATCDWCLPGASCICTSTELHVPQKLPSGRSDMLASLH